MQSLHKHSFESFNMLFGGQGQSVTTSVFPLNYTLMRKENTKLGPNSFDQQYYDLTSLPKRYTDGHVNRTIPPTPRPEAKHNLKSLPQSTSPSTRSEQMILHVIVVSNV